MNLYCFPIASTSRAVWLFCVFNKIPFELKKVDVFAAEHMSSSYLAVSTIHAVPVVKDATNSVHECGAILRYLTSKHNLHDPWYPEDPVSKSTVDMFIEWYLENLKKASMEVFELSTGHSLATHSAPRTRTSIDFEKVGMAMKDYLDVLKQLELNFLFNQDYLCGSKITIADVIALCELSYHQVFNADLATFPKVQQWYERLVEYFGESWTVVNEDFFKYVQEAHEQQKKQQEDQQKKARFGKDAKGGNKPPDIFHLVYYPRTPQEVYQMLTNEDELSKLTGVTCTFSAKPGGKFSYFDGGSGVVISGTNLFLMDNVKILQSWRSNDWPQNIFSTVKITLQKVEDGTHVSMTQSDVPPTSIKKMGEYWNNTLWKPTEGVLIRSALQLVFFENMSPHILYETMMDSAKLTKLLKRRCEMNRGVGAAFELCDGQIKGRNEDLVTDQKIVWRWRMSDWKENHFSTVSIELKRVAGGTDLTFSQSNIPVDKYNSVMEFWDRNFWKKIKKEVIGDV